MEPKTAANCRKDRFRKYMAVLPRSCDPSHPDQVAEDYALHRLRRGHPGITPVAAHGHSLNRATVFVKGKGVAFPRLLVKIQFHASAGFGIAQLQFSNP